ncbi:MAG: hypothetical protein GY810_32180 [Aureispira sp.]|nr:hypothetical protein [Aureispira sp.]
MAKKKKKDLHKDYEKIMQFLGSRSSKDILLGIQLLKASMDAKLISQVFSGGSYICYMITFPFVTFFQQNPELWKEVKPQIPSYFRGEITKWLPKTVLGLQNPTIPSFCELANKEIKKYFTDFPKLEPSILTEQHGYGYASTRKGNNIIDGIGWSFQIDEADIGPAETIHKEDWIAKAHHPDFIIKIQVNLDDRFPKVWLEKILPENA